MINLWDFRAVWCGVEFEEERHKYFYRGRELSGITPRIAEKLKMKINPDFVGIAAEEGTHVHKAIQRWIETGDAKSEHSSVRWIINTFPFDKTSTLSEVVVSDFEKYASAIDLVVVLPEGKVILLDIKNGVFKRDYCTLQLSVYKYFVEKFAGIEVAALQVISAKDKDYYNIYPYTTKEVERFLYHPRKESAV
jgi:hypothetical protein